MRRICTILARAGSTGVPGKNLRPLGGVPLVAHSIRHARATGLFEVLAVSTDDPGVRAIAREEGVDVIVERPADLATATAAKVPAIVHCVEAAELATGARFDVVVDLDVTSPLRIADDVVDAVALLEANRDADNVITVTPARRSPYFNLVEGTAGGRVRLVSEMEPPPVRRQDVPACFDMNASVYVWWREALTADARVVGAATLAHVMPEERSLDVDSELDWDLVAFLYARAGGTGGSPSGGKGRA